VYCLFMGIPGLSNQNNGQQRLGITEPISLAGPTEDDVIKTRELEKVLFALILNSCMYLLGFRVLLYAEYGFWVFSTCKVLDCTRVRRRLWVGRKFLAGWTRWNLFVINANLFHKVLSTQKKYLEL